jgi:uncharacterized 2Fe-2S/4Fe-4S cluster protein (DUF4445 family)
MGVLSSFEPPLSLPFSSEPSGLHRQQRNLEQEIRVKIMAPVIFYPSGRECVPDGRQTVLQLAGNLGLPFPSLCGGRKKCGKCRVRVEALDSCLPPPTDWEIEILGERIAQGIRLACETILSEGAKVHLLEQSRGQKPVILQAKGGRGLSLKLTPAVEAFYAVVPEADLESTMGDTERLLAALKKDYGLSFQFSDPEVLRTLPHALRSGKGTTILIRNRKEIIELYPAHPTPLCGMAFDLGTTTVVGYLFDLFTGKELEVVSALNPQIPFGADVISRLTYCQEQPEGLEKLRTLTVQGINALMVEATTRAAVPLDRIAEVTLAGNTVMHHLCLGLNPHFLATAPYPPVLQDPCDFRARDLGLHIHPSGYAHLLPLKAGFVGSDTVAGILASRLHRQKKLTLFLDLGTNGEVVLGNKERLLCCSAAAGPAFEGGHIRFGMGASEGAIDRVEIEPRSLTVHWRTIHNASPAGLCGSGIISAVAEMVRRGLLLANGNFNPDIHSPRLRPGPEGKEFVLVRGTETAHGQDITLSAKDISEVQMAKAALFAGIALLKTKWGDEPIEQLFLAGAFGNYTDPADAATIGLIPGDIVKRRAWGNAAGSGACLTLLNRHKRKEAERIARKMEYLELATHPRFQEFFVSGLLFRSAFDYTEDY